jgi:hypothetical protein
MRRTLSRSARGCSANWHNTLRQSGKRSIEHSTEPEIIEALLARIDD